MPMVRNPRRQYEDDYSRIRDELWALEHGAGDDIFQTRASPLEHRLPRNVAIDFNEAEGIAAYDNITRYRLNQLLPVGRTVTPQTSVSPELIKDVVVTFWSIASNLPQTPRNRDGIMDFLADVWCKGTYQIPDYLLRRLRPHAPQRWDMDCWIAQCLIQDICEKHNIPCEDVEADPEKKYIRLKPAEDGGSRLLASWEMLTITIYLARLASEIAAWLPSELMTVQLEPDQTVPEAFAFGRDYYQQQGPRAYGTFTKQYFHMCLGHALEFLEDSGWFNAPLVGDGESNRDMFWERLDYRMDTWASYEGAVTYPTSS